MVEIIEDGSLNSGRHILVRNGKSASCGKTARHRLSHCVANGLDDSSLLPP
jgi:hypothetical protein